MPFNAGKWWQIGFFDVIDLIQKYPDRNVYWDDRGDMGYIFILFKQKYDPAKFQKEVVRIDGPLNMRPVKNFDRYHFGEINWKNVCNDKNAIYIDDSKNFSNRGVSIPDGQLTYPNAYNIVYFLTSEEKCQKLEMN